MPNPPKHLAASSRHPEAAHKGGPHPLHFAPRATGDTPTPAPAGTWVDVEHHWEARRHMPQQRADVQPFAWAVLALNHCRVIPAGPKVHRH